MRSTNRKQFLQRMAAGGSLLAVPGLLAACGGGGIEGEDEGEATSAAAPAAPESSAASSAGGATSEAGASSAADVATSAQAETTAAASTGELADTLRISNWTLYIDIDEETNERPSLKAFEDEYGVKVEYTEDINSNEEFFGKVQAPLSKGQSIDRDLMVLTDYMAAARGRAGLRREARQGGDSQREEPAAGAGRSGLGPEPRDQHPVAVRLHGPRVRPREGRQGAHVGRRS